MTKKKKSILSDQRFIVLLVIIVLCAIFSGLSKEFRQYTTILSMLDFSYYDLLMAIGVTFPLITGGVDLSIGTGMVAYALIGRNTDQKQQLPGSSGNADLYCSWYRSRCTERCTDRCYEPAAIFGNTLYLYDYPWCRISLQCDTLAGTYTGRADGSIPSSR